MAKELPDHVRVVIVGGGVGGCSVAYHLAERGERDVLVVDRAELTSGSTFHSAGLVGVLRADPTLTRMNAYSVELYRKLEASEHPVGWVESGGIKLACTPERVAEIRRQIGWGRAFGLPLAEIPVSEAVDRFPLMSAEGVLSAAYLPMDGYVDPSQLAHSLAAGARRGRVRFATHTRVLGIDVDRAPNGVGAVRRVRTDRGDVTCDVVINCGGMYAAEIARMVGVRVPIVPMSHQYVVTEAFRQRTPGEHLPTLRDPDHLVYFREEVDGLLMGGYERQSAPWSLRQGLDRIPADFNGKLVAEDWPRFTEIASEAAYRMPRFAELGIRKLVNGPEAFTPDNEFCLGETAVRGFFVAAGFCAHGIAGAGGIGRVLADWVLDGDPGLDLSHMDIRRFGPTYASPSYTVQRVVENYETYYDIHYPYQERLAGRPLRTSPAYSWHAEHGAVFGEKAGWERVNWYARPGDLGAADDAGRAAELRPRGWAGRYWSPAIGVEHAATRDAVGLFDESSFAKFEVSGPGAAAFLDWMCDNTVAGPIGAVTYTQLLNARGGIECDLTVTRLEEQLFQLVTGTAFGSHDSAHLRRHAPTDGSVRVADVTSGWACYALWGPRARDVLRELTPADLDAFAYLTAQHTTVADVPVRALRVTFVGELGWELYCPAEYGAGLWRALVEAGEPHGLVPGGYRAIDSLRLEKGYRVWGADISPETSPYEVGLGFCVKLDKPGGFLGRDALVTARAAGSVRRRLRCLVLDDPRAVALGSEPVSVDGRVVGRVSSGGYGYTVGASIAYALLPAALGPGTAVSVDMFGEPVSGTVAKEPLYDPAGTRLRS